MPSSQIYPFPYTTLFRSRTRSGAGPERDSSRAGRSSPRLPGACGSQRRCVSVSLPPLLLDGLVWRLPLRPLGARGRPSCIGSDRKSTRLNSSHANISYAVFPNLPFSLHDALPISDTIRRWAREGFLEGRQVIPQAPWRVRVTEEVRERVVAATPPGWVGLAAAAQALGRSRQTILHWVRSEEHTSELQSRQYLVCRLPKSTLFPTRRSSDLGHDPALGQRGIPRGPAGHPPGSLARAGHRGGA